MDNFEEVIGYKFKNRKLLHRALTHSSYANESNAPSYERLEFLGDSILGFVVGEFLFRHPSNLNEGDLSKIRAAAVCEKSLHMFAQSVDIGQYMKLSKGEEQTGGRTRVSILADIVESVIAAVYLDSDFETVKDFILRNLGTQIDNAISGRCCQDYKTALQEYLQSITKDKIEYTLISEEGPDHEKTFTVSVSCGDKTLGTGNGRTKKEAEQNAAQIALEKVDK